ncbi:MAG: O-antigen ligase family protein [Candidatus Kapabacteria bacterium]|nr:O-antigen ligase family protein [Candidatus Kapabacteria bacterium]
MNIFADWPWLLPAIGGAVALIMAMVRFPKVWLGLFLVALPFFLTDTGKGVSVTESVSGGLFTITIILWMTWRMALNPRPLIRGWSDFLLIFFIVASAANVIVAKLNSIELFGWGVDWSYFLLMLYYFPFRDVFGENEKSFGQFLGLAAISSTLMALYSTYSFKQRMAENMIYAYQITASRSATLGPIFLLSICICVVIIFNSKWRTKFIGSVVVILNVAALVLTFTRTLWVLVFVCTLIAMLFMRFKQNFRLVAASIALASISVMVFYAINPKVAEVAINLVQSRFASSSQLSGGDRSFETRIIEVNNAWRKVEEAPLGGNGLRARFVTWAPIEQWHNSTAFVHIGYVGIIHKLGFPTAFILFAVLIGFSFRAFNAAIQSRHPSAPPLAKSLAVGVFAFIPAMYINIFMAGIFDQRYGNVMFAFIFA